jgi:hypothetical protein
MIWFEFNKYWTSVNKNVHIIRYEDLINNRKEALSDLLKFVFMTPSLESTRLEGYLDLALKQEPPQIYKPRKGLVNANYELFSEDDKKVIAIEGGKLLKNFGYYHLVMPCAEEPGVPKWIHAHNEKVLKKCLSGDFAGDEPILCNQPKILLRRKT